MMENKDKKNNDEKNKKVITILSVVLCCLLVILTVITFMVKNKRTDNNNLQKILNESVEIKSVVDNEKRIELMSLEGQENLEKITVWVFSEPVYLGEFTLVKNDNKYYLEGLNDILKSKDLAIGSHRLLVMNGKESVGYIRIEITENKELKSDDIYLDNGTNNEIGTDESIGSQDNDSNVTDDKKTNSNDKTTSDKTNSSSTASNTTTGSNNKKEDTSKTTEKVTEEPKQEEVKCTPKKFKNKYTYVFEDKETCAKNGDQIDAWNYFRANGIPATVYGCEEIVDECGTTYYGVYYGNTENQKFYY